MPDASAAKALDYLRTDFLALDFTNTGFVLAQMSLACGCFVFSISTYFLLSAVKVPGQGERLKEPSQVDISPLTRFQSHPLLGAEDIVTGFHDFSQFLLV